MRLVNEKREIEREMMLPVFTKKKHVDVFGGACMQMNTLCMSDMCISFFFAREGRNILLSQHRH